MVGKFKTTMDEGGKGTVRGKPLLVAKKIRNLLIGASLRRLRRPLLWKVVKRRGKVFSAELDRGIGPDIS